MVWFILAGMAAVAALAAIWPVLRRSPETVEGEAAASEAAFYKAQLDEIERDVGRGQLPHEEAASARAEAARRLLALHPEAPKAQASSPRERNRFVAAV